MKIREVYGREILDSRGFPTVECILKLDNGITVAASAPSGASTGTHEAHELRDGDNGRFSGKGVLKAINNITSQIQPLIVGKEPNVMAMDELMIACDGTENLARLGANAVIATSIAITKAQALSNNLPLFKMLQILSSSPAPSMPHCMFNIINGGMHADSGLSIQEFMVIPTTTSIDTALEHVVTVYYALKDILKKRGYATSIGDEGGFAPSIRSSQEEIEALDLLMEAIALAGFGHDEIKIGLDCAASSFYASAKNRYTFNHQTMDSEELIALYETLVKNYPIISIEDGLAEDDWQGWQLLTKTLGSKIQLVGDDLFVTNTRRIKQGIATHCANAVLIKPNQIGTVSATLRALELCRQNNYASVISHRSGETNDSFIADLAVGSGAGQMKSGAPVRGERIAKYNRLLDIQALL